MFGLLLVAEKEFANVKRIFLNISFSKNININSCFLFHYVAEGILISQRFKRNEKEEL